MALALPLHSVVDALLGSANLRAWDAEYDVNILLINHYAGSKRHGMEYRPFYLAREWVRSGHQVTIVAASHSHVRTQAPTVEGTSAEEEIDGIRYLWLRTPGYQGNGSGRVLNIMAFVGQLLRHKKQLVGMGQQGAVIASSTYPLDSFPAHSIARNARARLVYEVHDLWPLTPIELGGMSPRHPFIMLLQWAENFAYRKAHHVASMLPKADGHMRAHGMAEHKFAYVPNGIDVAEWQGSGTSLPPEHAAVLSRLKSEGRFVVGYAGAHGLANALHSLVDAAQLLSAQPVGVVLVGQGPEKGALQKIARQKGLVNTVFLPPVPKASVPALLREMDALFISLKRTSLFRFGISPNKLMDYMMAGKPIIQAIDAGNDAVAESGCGVSIPPEEPEAIARAISHLIRLSPVDRQMMGRKGQEYVVANHDYRLLADRFLRLMQQPVPA